MSHAARPSQRASVVGVLGEVLLTLGALIALYLLWEFVLDDAGARAGQQGAATDLIQQWGVPPTGGGDGTASTDPNEPELPADPPDIDTPTTGERFAVLHVPRFGWEWQRPILAGTSTVELAQGLGWYPETHLPGQAGNFAVAGHRTTHGSPFNSIAELRVGDAIVVESEEGWFVYRFRNLVYVLPTGVDVLLPVPQQPNATATQPVLTMTSCNPMYSAAERIVAFSVFDRFVPRRDGAPSELAAA